MAPIKEDDIEIKPDGMSKKHNVQMYFKNVDSVWLFHFLCIVPILS